MMYEWPAFAFNNGANLHRLDPFSMARWPLCNRLAALQLVVLSLPRAPAVLLRSGSLLALGSASQWRSPSVA
jgi:hypothetical protein